MSSLTTLARPYAKAAFALAQKADALAGWDDLLTVSGDIVAEPKVAAVLSNPQFKAAQAVELIGGALGAEANEAYMGFLTVLGENGRLSLLPEVARLFRQLRQDAEQRLSVRVVSAVALEAAQVERLQKALAQRFEREIEMQQVIDDSVLGGAVIYAGDQVIDGSLRGRLQKLRASL